MTTRQSKLVAELRRTGWTVDEPSLWRRSPSARLYDEHADVTIYIGVEGLIISGAWGRPNEVVDRIAAVIHAAEKIDTLAQGSESPGDLDKQ